MSLLRRLTYVRTEATSTSLANGASAALGLVRDLLIVVALGLSYDADAYFLSLQVVQTLYWLGFGGTTLVFLQADIARIARVTSRFAPTMLLAISGRRRLAVVAAAVSASAFVAVELRTNNSGTAAAVGVLAGLATLVRARVEILDAVAASYGAFAVPSLIAATQNLGVIVAAALTLTSDSGLSAIWVGVVLGFLTNWVVLHVWLVRQGRLAPRSVRLTSPAPSARGESAPLAAHIALTQVPQVADQAVMSALVPGGAAAFALARRIVGALGTILIMPLRNMLLVNAARNAEVVGVPVLGFSAIALVLSQLIAVALYIGKGWVAETELELVATLVLVLGPGVIASAAHAVMARVSHASGVATGPFRRALFATTVHVCGILLAYKTSSLELLALAYSLGWTLAIMREERSARGLGWEGGREVPPFLAVATLSTLLLAGGRQLVASKLGLVDVTVILAMTLVAWSRLRQRSVAAAMTTPLMEPRDSRR